MAADLCVCACTCRVDVCAHMCVCVCACVCECVYNMHNTIQGAYAPVESVSKERYSS